MTGDSGAENRPGLFLSFWGWKKRKKCGIINMYKHAHLMEKRRKMGTEQTEHGMAQRGAFHHTHINTLRRGPPGSKNK